MGLVAVHREDGEREDDRRSEQVVGGEQGRARAGVIDRVDDRLHGDLGGGDGNHRESAWQEPPAHQCPPSWLRSCDAAGYSNTISSAGKSRNTSGKSIFTGAF